jgi:hypothetical protein
MVEVFQWSKDPRLGPGSLWAALPIPACRVLTYAGHTKASLVLYAMILHSSDTSKVVFPSRATLAKYSGVGKNSITGAIKTLEKFGFVKVIKIPKGRTYRNSYEVLRPCFHWDEFNPVAIRYRVPKGWCTRCNNYVFGPDWIYEGRANGITSVRVRIHKGCRGEIRDLAKKQLKEIQAEEESAGMFFDIPG